LDIPDEDKDWTSEEHVILFITEYTSSRQQSDPDHDTTQFFLILKREGIVNGVRTYTRVGVGHTDDEYVLEITEEHGWKAEKVRIL
jgi:hypothetical protein